MSEVVIYHNPRCRKSRESLNYLIHKGIENEVVKYLETPLERSQLKKLLAKLNMDVRDLIRKEEREYKEKYKGKEFTDDEWLIILEENPKLIQRPIVVKGNRAVIGRPLENVKNLFE